jgi:hypothetical protein
MRGISWLAEKTDQLLKKDSAPWSLNSEDSNIKCSFKVRGISLLNKRELFKDYEESECVYKSPPASGEKVW